MTRFADSPAFVGVQDFLSVEHDAHMHGPLDQGRRARIIPNVFDWLDLHRKRTTEEDEHEKARNPNHRPEASLKNDSRRHLYWIEKTEIRRHPTIS